MTLAPGTRVAAYEITSAIGAGGMGEVYRARDTRLKRDVALKFLPASLASDPDRVARFGREAELLAALNHPNIAGLYGIEEVDDTLALVMEFVEGEDLSTRIARGALPLDEALPLARQVADALEAAHERGIIHRDLKPANQDQARWRRRLRSRQESGSGRPLRERTAHELADHHLGRP